MNTREWALLAFTIFGQTAAGLMIVLMIVRTFIAGKSGNDLADRLTNRPLFMVVPFMALALLASLLHLGSPLHIVRAVPNIGSSWLSREVVLAVSFVVFAALFTFLQWRKVGSESLRTVTGWITAVIAAVYIYAMGMVYMIPTQPSWNTLATPLTFIAGSLLLGTLAMAVGLVAGHALEKEKKGEDSKLLHNVLQGLAVTAIFLLGVEFLVLPLYLAYLATQGTAALQSLNLMVGSYSAVLFLRLLVLFVGAGVLAGYLYRNASVIEKEKTLVTLAYSAFALVLVGEVLGRFIFYATHYRIGI
jgi:anaerobic dimethyl sulfoxide reductase subunit C (anchor subunit)